MTSPRVRADYDGLAKLSQAFARQAAETEKTLQSIQNNLRTLRSGDWIGTGANAFFAEMDQQVLPSLRRLATALNEADRVTRQMSQVMKQAEEEAARLFQAAFVGGAAAAVGGAVGVAAGVSAASDPASGWGPGKLLVRDPYGLFTDDYMHGLIGLQVRGAGGELRAAMKDLLKNPEGEDLKRALQRVAELRGRPFGEINDEYQKFTRTAI
jgi:WXG100 family type VII secretion target